VPRLVHHLRRAVQLAVVELNGLGDLRGREERALLAVEELAEEPRRHRMHPDHALLLVELRADAHLEVVEVEEALGEKRLLRVERIDARAPRQLNVAVPLQLLRLRVERVHLLVVARIRPVEVRGVVGRRLRRLSVLRCAQHEAAHAGRRDRAENAHVADLREDVERVEPARHAASHLLRKKGRQPLHAARIGRRHTLNLTDR
jgi:hypothetical protein